MKPEDIRNLYREEGEATAEEAADTYRQIRTDPETARAHLKVVYSLSVEDREFAMLLRLFLEGMLMRQIEERAMSDDAYALECGNLMLDLQAAMKPASVPRGKPKKARSA